MSQAALSEIQIAPRSIQLCPLISPTAILRAMEKKNSEVSSPITMSRCRIKFQRHLLQEKEHNIARSYIRVMPSMTLQSLTGVTMSYQIRSGRSRVAVQGSVLRSMICRIKSTWHHWMSQMGILQQTSKCNSINRWVARARRGLNRTRHICQDPARDHPDTDHTDQGLIERVQPNRNQRGGIFIKGRCPSSSCTSTEDLPPSTKYLKREIQIKEDIMQTNQSTTILEAHRINMLNQVKKLAVNIRRKASPTLKVDPNWDHTRVRIVRNLLTGASHEITEI